MAQASSRVPKAGRKEITTRMFPELAEAVRQAAEKEGLTVNDFIVEAVEAELVRRAARSGRLDDVHARVHKALLGALAELLDQEAAIPA